MGLIETIQSSGIVGAGGAGFPTHVKLDTKAECFIINAAECEPLIETDKFLCRTFPDKVVGGTAIAAAHLGAKRIVIALKGKYQDEIAALKASIKKAGVNIEIFEMPTFYPAGDEQTMVHMVTGKVVPERGIPLEVGVVVNNVGTMMNLYEAVHEGKPVCDKYLSVVGEVEKPIMLHVPIGTAIEECIKKAGPKVRDYAVILGGPMMGSVLKDPEEVSQSYVTKTSGNIIVLPKDHFLITRSTVPIERLKQQARSACIQCRFCTDLCPRYLIGHRIRPHLVMRNVWLEDQTDDNGRFEELFGDAVNCCDCGICELFSCPMGLSPRLINVYMKDKLRERGINVPKTSKAEALDVIDMHRVPTERLVTRLNLGKYYTQNARDCFELNPEQVYIPFAQHIGKPAEPCVSQGDKIQKGQLLAKAQGAVSANIHASISGTIVKVDAKGASISRKGESI